MQAVCAHFAPKTFTVAISLCRIYFAYSGLWLRLKSDVDSTLRLQCLVLQALQCMELTML